MKKSRYHLLRIIDNKYYLVNILNSTLISLTKYEYEILCEKSDKTLEILNSNLLDKLIQNGMLIEDGVDELQLLKKRYIEEQSRKDLLTITIAPTLNCNFVCFPI